MQSFQSGDVEIAFVDEGDPRAEPILLIHGFASSRRVNWAETGWIRALTEAGRRVVAMDVRGHGQSGKPHDPVLYLAPTMADDALALLDHLGVGAADVMGYSMGARITAFLAIRHGTRVRSAIFGGLGQNMVLGIGGGEAIADALEAPSLEAVTEPGPRAFRLFAERTGSDLLALAACMRSTRVRIAEEDLHRIVMPALVVVGEKDDISGPAAPLAAMMPQGTALTLPGRDHMSAVGAREYKAAVIEFLESRP